MDLHFGGARDPLRAEFFCCHMERLHPTSSKETKDRTGKNREEDLHGLHLNLEDLPSILSQFTAKAKYIGEKAQEGDYRSLVIIFSFLSCVSVFLGIFENILSSVAACAYPLYMSFKAINTEETADDRRWLVYWVVYGAIRIIERFPTFLNGNFRCDNFSAQLFFCAKVFAIVFAKVFGKSFWDQLIM